jgi:spore coat polysaccharide biosynthesis protein SpsF
MKIIAIVQARTGSTRLPGKVFLPLCGKPLIWHIIRRVSSSKLISQVVLATTINKNDDQLEYWAQKENIDIYRGSEENVLERFYKASIKFKADIIVRITADDPFKDPEVIDDVIKVFLKNKLDFAFNNYPPSYPEGLDVEVFTFNLLKYAFENSNDSFEHEHVTQFFFRNLSKMNYDNISIEGNFSNLRWTIDTKEDYLMTKEVYDNLYKEGSLFLMKDIISLLATNPEITKINEDVTRSTMYK